MTTAAVTPLRLLVVCTANQCRSPLGEVIARHRLAALGVDALVMSAGTRAVAGMPATDGAQEVATKMGLDLSEHESQPVTPELAADADVIVTMERAHLLSLITEHGAAMGKVFTLLDLASRAEAAPRNDGEAWEPWLARAGVDRSMDAVLGGGGGRGLGPDEIEDPIGRSSKHYRAAAEQIDEAVASLFEGMFGEF